MQDDMVCFVQNGLGSVWALHLMLFLARHPDRAWDSQTLVRELRASKHIMERLLPRFERIGLVIQAESGRWVWQPSTDAIRDLVQRVQQAQDSTPFALLQLIANARDDNLQIFVDSFLVGSNKNERPPAKTGKE